MLDITTECDSILNIIKTSSFKIIGIDGIDGVGKTTLAKNIEEFGYRRLSVDDFLQKKSGNYFDFINFARMKKISAKLSNKSIVIEGVLLQKILKKLQLIPDYLIYVVNSIWIYDWVQEFQGKYCDLTLEEIISEVETGVNRLKKVTDPGSKPYKMSGLRREIYEYTFKYKPWLTADKVVRKG